jgi:tetratricopeptide (TPR) repeat protein
MGHHEESEHLSLEFLTRVREGRLPLSVAFAHLLSHLTEVCPHCRLVIEEHEAEAVESRITMGSGHLIREVAKGVAAAKRDLERLDRELNFEARTCVAQRSRRKMRSRYLVELLLERVHERTTRGQLQGALDDCRLACVVAQRVPDSEAGLGGSRDLVILARAHWANALRIAQRPEAAEAILASLLAHVSEMVVPSMEAEVLSFAASLRIVQQRYDEALGLLQRELAIHRLLADNHLQGRALVQVARAQFGRGEIRRAIDTARASLLQIDETEHRDLLAAVHNLARYLEAADETLEAAELLENYRSLYEEFSSDVWLRGRFFWLQARILERQGEPQASEVAFRQARRHFLDHDIAYSAALATLDLAKLLLEQGRFKEVQTLAEESADVLHKGALHGYASEAFDLFRQAALAEALSVAELIRIADYLRRAERDPGLRFTGIS